MRPSRRHANALTQRGMRVNGFSDVDGVGSHLDRQCRYADSTFYIKHGIPAQLREVGA